jgi:hypothetical protein
VGAPVNSLPGASTVCAAITVDRLDVAWKAYDAAIDAVNMLVDAKVLTPGSARALAVAQANDAVLAGLQTAEHARSACNATDYGAALQQVTAALADLRVALRSK